MSTPGFFQQAKKAMELRNQMKKIQKELESQIVEYENGGVVVRARGDMTLASVKIQPESIDMARLDKLERLILDNSNKALKQAKDQASTQMQQMTKGMGLDGLLGG